MEGVVVSPLTFILSVATQEKVAPFKSTSEVKSWFKGIPLQVVSFGKVATKGSGSIVTNNSNVLPIHPFELKGVILYSRSWETPLVFVIVSGIIIPLPSVAPITFELGVITQSKVAPVNGVSAVSYTHLTLPTKA